MGTLNDYFIPVGYGTSQTHFKPIASFRSKINLIKNRKTDPQSDGLVDANSYIDYVIDQVEKQARKVHEDAYERAKKATETM